MKGYVFVQVCFVTKAEFFDLVLYLSAYALLASLNFSIYGAPTEIHSDNGLKFVGANSVLRRLYKKDPFSIL